MPEDTAVQPDAGLRTIEIDLPIFNVQDPVARDKGWTEEWLDDVVAGFSEFNQEDGVRLTPPLAFAKEPPVKIGHNEEQPLAGADQREDGKPSFGWVTSVWRSGPVLWAKFSQVPSKLGQLINAGRWKRVSAEFYCQVPWKDRVFSRVLRAVSLLGQDPPAIKSLADVVALHSEDSGTMPYIVEAFSSSTEGLELVGDTELQVIETYAVWSSAYINDLPDSSFAYIEPGGTKDGDGKTNPRSLRHLPYKDKDGEVDIIHLRNALSRLPQTNIPEDAKKKALAKLNRYRNLLSSEKEDNKEVIKMAGTEEAKAEVKKGEDRQEVLPGMKNLFSLDKEEYDELVVKASVTEESKRLADEATSRVKELEAQVEKMSEEAKSAEQLRAQVNAEKEQIKIKRIELFVEKWQGAGKVDGKGRPMLESILMRSDSDKVQKFGEGDAAENVSLFDLIVKYHESLPNNCIVDLAEHANTAEEDKPSEGNPIDKDAEKFAEVAIEPGKTYLVAGLKEAKAIEKYLEEHPDKSWAEASKIVLGK